LGIPIQEETAANKPGSPNKESQATSSNPMETAVAKAKADPKVAELPKAEKVADNDGPASTPASKNQGAAKGAAKVIT
jgi:hypothetical protein